MPRYVVIAHKPKSSRKTMTVVVHAKHIRQAQRRARRKLGRRYTVVSVMHVEGKPVKGSRATQAENR